MALLSVKLWSNSKCNNFKCCPSSSKN